MDILERERHTYNWVLQLATCEARRCVVGQGAAIVSEVQTRTQAAIRKARLPKNFTPVNLGGAIMYKAMLEACIIANNEAGKGIYNHVQQSEA